MTKRLLTAAVLIAIAVAFLYLQTISDVWFGVFINVAMVLAVYEMTRAFRGKMPQSVAVTLILFSAVTYLVYFLASVKILMAVMAGVFFLCFFLTMLDENGTLEGVALAALVLFYPIGILILAYRLNADCYGLFFLLHTMFVTVLCDTFAFFVGSAVGGRKLCERLSPKKTLSGAIGGLAGGIAGAAIAWVLFQYVFSLYPGGRPYSIWVCLGGGAVGAVMSILGDLAESFVKRQVGIKDMSNLLPGHGGVMDRIDALIANLFVTYVLFVVIL